MQSFASIVGFIAIVYLSLFQWSRSQNGIDSVGLSDGSMSIRDWLLTELELAGIADDVNGTRQEEDTLLKFNEMALFKPMEDLNVRIQLDDSRDWKIADMPFRFADNRVRLIDEEAFGKRDDIFGLVDSMDLDVQGAVAEDPKGQQGLLLRVEENALARIPQMMHGMWLAFWSKVSEWCPIFLGNDIFAPINLQDTQRFVAHKNQLSPMSRVFLMDESHDLLDSFDAPYPKPSGLDLQLQEPDSVSPEPLLHPTPSRLADVLKPEDEQRFTNYTIAAQIILESVDDFAASIQGNASAPDLQCLRNTTLPSRASFDQPPKPQYRSIPFVRYDISSLSLADAIKPEDDQRFTNYTIAAQIILESVDDFAASIQGNASAPDLQCPRNTTSPSHTSFNPSSKPLYHPIPSVRYNLSTSLADVIKPEDKQRYTNYGLAARAILESVDDFTASIQGNTSAPDMQYLRNTTPTYHIFFNPSSKSLSYPIQSIRYNLSTSLADVIKPEDEQRFTNYTIAARIILDSVDDFAASIQGNTSAPDMQYLRNTTPTYHIFFNPSSKSLSYPIQSIRYNLSTSLADVIKPEDKQRFTNYGLAAKTILESVDDFKTSIQGNVSYADLHSPPATTPEHRKDFYHPRGPVPISSKPLYHRIPSSRSRPSHSHPRLAEVIKPGDKQSFKASSLSAKRALKMVNIKKPILEDALDLGLHNKQSAATPRSHIRLNKHKKHDTQHRLNNKASPVSTKHWQRLRNTNNINSHSKPKRTVQSSSKILQLLVFLAIMLHQFRTASRLSPKCRLS